MTPPAELPTAWAVLARALSERRTVRALYHGRERILCPHLLGWKDGRPKVLAYQAGVAWPPTLQDRGWRSLFVDQIEDPTIDDDHSWQSADNYSTATNCVDEVALVIPAQSLN